MATIFDYDGRELSASDKGLLGLLAACGDLTYLERKTLSELITPQYNEVLFADGHPLNIRLNELTQMIKQMTEDRVRKIKYGRKVKPNKRM